MRKMLEVIRKSAAKRKELPMGTSDAELVQEAMLSIFGAAHPDDVSTFKRFL